MHLAEGLTALLKAPTEDVLTGDRTAGAGSRSTVRFCTGNVAIILLTKAFADIISDCLRIGDGQQSLRPEQVSSESPILRREVVDPSFFWVRHLRTILHDLFMELRQSRFPTPTIVCSQWPIILAVKKC